MTKEEIKQILRKTIIEKRIPGLAKEELKKELEKRTELPRSKINYIIQDIEERQKENGEIKVLKIGRVRFFYLKEFIDIYIRNKGGGEFGGKYDN